MPCVRCRGELLEPREGAPLGRQESRSEPGIDLKRGSSEGSPLVGVFWGLQIRASF